ncbi:protein phosphatase 2C domain-containing protein [Candidatus Uhrbacteria bacterium]|nr:protein phosphatase 2C domain-containing protein [Candidatus Uhrbacteria bacterium]
MDPENPFGRNRRDTLVPERRPDDLQALDIVHAFRIEGFKGLEVAATLEKKRDAVGEKGSRNGDAILVDPTSGLLGVFDGLGGEKYADLASATASRMTKVSWDRSLASWTGDTRAIDETFRENDSDEGAEDILRGDPDFLRKAHALVVSLLRAHAAVKATGGMTTACVGCVHEQTDGTRWLLTASVGDSGAFIRHDDGTLERASREDSNLDRLKDIRGLQLPLLYRMKAEPYRPFEIPRVPHATTFIDLTNEVPDPLGTEGVIYPKMVLKRLRPGDDVLFCTDGVIDKYEKVVRNVPPESEMTEEQLDLEVFARAAGNGDTLEERLERLRITASFRRAYKEVDDIAIVGIHVPKRLKGRGK